VRDTARILRVHENTVRNWASNGVLKSSKVPGPRAHRFKRAEVERLQRDRGGSSSSVGPHRRQDGPELVGPFDLDPWAARDDAKTAFPELMDRLLTASTGVTNVNVRSHEGKTAHGWDGTARSSPTRADSRARPVRHGSNGPDDTITESTGERDSQWVSAETELLSLRLVQKVEADLAQASMDIHDGVAQSMSNAIQILQVVYSGQSLDKGDRDRINRVVVLLREGISYARLISRQLLPASLERLGLAKTLKYQLENLDVVGVSSSFTFEAPDPLPKPLEMALYRIASEALLNVKKHARAKNVTLSITSQQNELTMTILDDGVGFERDAQEPNVETGLGLMSMLARASLLGGTFTIVKAQGGGTVVTVVLPTTLRGKRNSPPVRS
jgi:signal transduction histidine kinase